MGLFKHNKDKSDAPSTLHKDAPGSGSNVDSTTGSGSRGMAPATTGVGLGSNNLSSSNNAYNPTGPASTDYAQDAGNQRYDPQQGGNTLQDPNVAGRGAHHNLRNDRQIDPAVSGGAYDTQQQQLEDERNFGRSNTDGGHYPKPTHHHESHHHGTGGNNSGNSSHVGTEALAESRLAKERELQAINSQTQELQEAERLEQEARMHRARAVEFGAHPDNKHLGGIVP